MVLRSNDNFPIFRNDDRVHVFATFWLCGGIRNREREGGSLGQDDLVYKQRCQYTKPNLLQSSSIAHFGLMHISFENTWSECRAYLIALNC